MTRPRPLTHAQLAAALDALPGWSLEGEKLHRTFRFRDFPQAFAFMTASALAAEKLDHHPEWWNVHHTVKVWLRTHEPAGITELDVELAKTMGALAERLGANG
jgi:4a-hydroxytetrahydrobiopterin dehydratase